MLRFMFPVMWVVEAAEEAAQQAAPAQAPAAPQASMVSLLMPFVVMILIFYVLLWRPQQQQNKRRAEMLRSLAKGDRVITTGGIHGEITGLKDDVVMKIIDTMTKNKAEMVAVAPIMNDFAVEAMHRKHIVPYHPAALKYFQEHNIPAKPYE